jgi:hypothetical protein
MSDNKRREGFLSVRTLDIEFQDPVVLVIPLSNSGYDRSTRRCIYVFVTLQLIHLCVTSVRLYNRLVLMSWTDNLVELGPRLWHRASYRLRDARPTEHAIEPVDDRVVLTLDESLLEYIIGYVEILRFDFSPVFLGSCRLL